MNIHDAFSEYDILTAAQSIYRKRTEHSESFENPSTSKEYFHQRLHLYDKEVFAVAFLDTRHRLITYEELFYGTLDQAAVYPREVLRRTLAHNAAAVIVSHNHPSGNPEPSQADIAMTQRLKQALELIDARLLDHIVIGTTPTSLAERGF